MVENFELVLEVVFFVVVSMSLVDVIGVVVGEWVCVWYMCFLLIVGDSLVVLSWFDKVVLKYR